MSEETSPDDAVSPTVLAILEEAAEPESEDPRTWEPPQVLALAVRYAFAVEALPKRSLPEWDEASAMAEEILFLRDLIEEWLCVFGEEALEDLLVGDFNEIALPSEADERLEQLYLTDPGVRDYLHQEYNRFRSAIEPPRSARWWWLDAELYGKQVH